MLPNSVSAPGGEDGNLALIALDWVAIDVAQREVDLGALGAADPFGLHLA